MINIKKPPGSNSIKGQLKSLIRDFAFETGREVRELGREMIKGVTMLPMELVNSARDGEVSGDKDKKDDWAKEWLKDKDQKDKPPLSDKEGGHSKIDPAKAFQKDDQASIERIQKQIAGSLNSQYRQASAQSTYGQQKAQERQEAAKPIYEKIWQEKEEKARQQAQSQPKQIMDTGSKRKAGDWRHGARKKKSPNPQELNRQEFADKGKQ